MAILSHSGVLRGAVGKFVHYPLNGKNIIKAKPASYKPKPKSMKWAQNFGKASALSACIKKHFGFLYDYDGNLLDMQRRLTSRLSYWFHSQEQPQVYKQDSFTLLEGFQLSKDPFASIDWKRQFEVTADPFTGLQVSMQEFDTPRFFEMDPCAWRVVLNISAISIDLAGMTVKEMDSVCFDIMRPDGGPIPSQQLSMNVHPSPGELTVVLASVSLYDSAKKLLRRGKSGMETGEIIAARYSDPATVTTTVRESRSDKQPGGITLVNKDAQPFNKATMKSNKSAGILLYRQKRKELEVFLVHPGGPFWKNKDAGAWTIPKGEFEDEDPLVAAKRELLEETGLSVKGTVLALTPIKQKSGKIVYAFALEGDADPASVKSNSFEMEWPPKSGRMQQFPEVDRAAWFSMEEAKQKIIEAQVALLIELAQQVGK